MQNWLIQLVWTVKSCSANGQMWLVITGLNIDWLPLVYLLAQSNVSTFNDKFLWEISIITMGTNSNLFQSGLDSFGFNSATHSKGHILNPS